MKARYGDPTNALVILTLEPGESLGSHSCAADAKEPVVRPILVSPQNPEGDEVLELIKKGHLIPVPLFPAEIKFE